MVEDDMKLLNNTPIPDRFLRAVLVKAGRSVGAWTSKTVVQVNVARNFAMHGLAQEAFITFLGGRERNCEGVFKVNLYVLRRLRSWSDETWEFRKQHYDPLRVAELFFELCQHEWGHIRAYQCGGRRVLPFSVASGAAKRRPRHDSRPEEIRAENYVFDANERGRGAKWASEEIADLAMSLGGIAGAFRHCPAITEPVASDQ